MNWRGRLYIGWHMSLGKKSSRPRLCAAEREKIAYLIGGGASASEVSEEFPHMTPRAVYEHARRAGLRFVDKARDQSAIAIVLSSKALDEAVAHASARGLTPERMIGRLIEELVVDRALLRRLAGDGQIAP
jgi:hypothetical protein